MSKIYNFDSGDISGLDVLCGEHILTGYAEGFTSDKEYTNKICSFILDGYKYTAAESREDSYRSHMKYVDKTKDESKPSFVQDVVVSLRRKDTGLFDYDNLIIQMHNKNTGKLVLEVGTKDISDYYPCFIHYFDPKELDANKEHNAMTQIISGDQQAADERVCPNCGYDKIYPIVQTWDNMAVQCSQCNVFFNLETGNRVFPPPEKAPPIEERGIEFFYMDTQEWVAMLSRYSKQIQHRMIATHIGQIVNRILIHTARQDLRHKKVLYDEHGETGFASRCEKPEIKHVWFTNKDLDYREIRPGNPPSDSQRPWWLKGIALEIDVSQVPYHIWEAVVPGGWLDQMIADEQMYRENEQAHAKSIMMPYDWEKDKKPLIVA